MLLRRLSDLKPDLVKTCREREGQVKTSPYLFCWRKGNKTYVIDGNELTGPVSERRLELWLNNMPQFSQIVLITMGFFTQDAYKAVLGNQRRRERIILISLGLRDYMDMEPQPKVLNVSKAKELYSALEDVLGRYGIRPSPVTCSRCRDKAIAFCETCSKLLCKRHLISCPLCRVILCHPDTASNCFSQHRCQQ